LNFGPAPAYRLAEAADQENVMSPLPPRTRRPLAVATVLAVLVAGLVAVGAVTARPASAEIISPTASGVWTVDGHGFGHGHGLSQYGARGAARPAGTRAGLTSRQIIAFYYPGTVLTTLSQPSIRVQIGSDGGATTVVVPAGQTITLSWAGGSMSTTSAGASRLRLVGATTAGHLQAQYFRTTWVNWGGALPSRADFSSSAGSLRLLQPSGSTQYRGTIGTVLDPSQGRLTINRLPLDSYVQGVVPREMPASWEPAAVQSQAIAARSYARYSVEHNGSSSYDICDSTNCQVYGGQARYDLSGGLVYSEDPASNQAVAATANQVATYQGATIFAQFSSSDGGWTASGGQPYLVAEADPYAANAGDPNLNWSRQVRVSDVASYYGLARLTQISITGRDGHGEWGGRVLTAVVSGTNSAGAAVSISTTGYSLSSAMGLPHQWFHVSAVTAGAPASVSAVARDAAALVSWTPPTVIGSDAITGYSITVPSVQRVVVGAGSRSAWIGGLHNGQQYTASVRAINSAGEGAPASVVIAPVAAPSTVRVVSPARILDSRVGAATTPTNPLLFGVGGHGSIPTSGVSAVQLAVTIVTPSASGVLRVYNDGSAVPVAAAIGYRTGRTVTATLSVPLTTSGRIAFAPTAGSLYVVLDQLSYSTAGASQLTATGPGLLMDTATVGTGAGRVVGLAAAVPATATAAVVQILGSSSAGPGWIRVWPQGTAPLVSQVSIPAAGRSSNTVIVPLAADRSIRIAASAATIGGQVSLVGYLAPTATGLLETVPITGTADTRASAGTDLAVSATPALLSLAGTAQLPTSASGFSAVLLHLTTSAVSGSGRLRVYADGAAVPRAVTVALTSGVGDSTTVLVPVSAGGAIRFVSDGATARVAVDIVGYVTG
jgi:SpoIID/LytB domain protein